MSSTKSPSQLLAGGIVAIFGPISFIGHFLTGTTATYIIGGLFLAFLIAIIVVPLTTAHATADSDDPNTWGTPTLATIIVSGFALFSLYIAGLVMCWLTYSKNK